MGFKYDVEGNDGFIVVGCFMIVVYEYIYCLQVVFSGFDDLFQDLYYCWIDGDLLKCMWDLKSGLGYDVCEVVCEDNYIEFYQGKVYVGVW